jgi:hypothetical protein
MKPNESAAILPCPFCGAESPQDRLLVCHQPWCFLSYDDDAHVADKLAYRAAWNRRAPSAPTPEIQP